MGIGENIKLLREKYGLSQKELGLIAGVSDKAVSTWEQGLKEPRMGAIQKIADHFGLQKSNIIEENGLTLKMLSIHTALQPAKYRKFKVLGNIACGQPIEAVQEQEEYIETELNVHADYVLHCQGDSMINARIFDGDYVFIKEQPVVENGEIAAVCMDGTVTLKRFFKYDTYIELRAENPMYPPIIIHPNDFNSIQIIGKAVACQFFVK